MRHGFRAAFAVSLIGVGFGACSPVASADPVPQVATDGGRRTVVDDPTIVGDHPVHVDAWSRAGSADAVSVQFTLASPDCTGVHAEVRETGDSVTVDLRAGLHPAAVGRVCTMIVVPAALDVALQSPLGNRTVFSAF